MGPIAPACLAHARLLSLAMSNAPSNPASETLPAEATPAAPPVEDLADRVDQLLANITEVSERLDKTLEESASPVPAAAGVTEETSAVSTEAPPQEPRPEVSAPTASEPVASKPAATEPPMAAVPEVEDLLSQVDMLLRDAASAPEPVAAASASAPLAIPEKVPPAKPEEIKSLDDQLAKLTENMLEQVGGALPPDPAPAVSSASASTSAAPLPSPGAVPAPPAKPEPAPVAQAAKASPSTSVAPAAAPPHAEKPAGSPAAVVAPSPATGAPSPGLWTRLEPVLLKALAILASPLRNKPESWRQTLGWAAVTTMFTSGILWAVVAFRPPPKPIEQEHAFDFAHGDAPSVPHEEAGEGGHAEAGGEHGASAEGHGEPKAEAHGGEKKSAGKKPPAKPSKSKSKGKGTSNKSGGKAADSHGSGGH